MTRLKQLFHTFLATLMISVATSATAAPKAELWERWSAHDPESTQVIDHQAWQQTLERYVSIADDGINRFAYGDVDAAERDRLQAYLRRLSNVEISRYNRDQQRAYWINLYNALTVEVILENYPVESIRDIKSGFFSGGPWDLELIEVEKQKLTLNDIEHRILRPIWQDPRIHYAVNCASLGCPNLQVQAYTAANSDGLMQSAAVAFVNHPRGAQVVDGKLRVSSIYDWFEDDFGGSDAGVIAHLQQYAEGDLLAALQQISRVDDDSYDWNINSATQSP